MAVGGEYTVQLQVILNTKGVLAQIAQIQKQAGKVIIGGAGTGKGAGGFAAIGKEANRTAAGVRRLNGAIGATGKNVKKIEGRKLAGVYTDAGKSAKQATSNIKSFGSTTLDITKKVAQFGAVTAVIRGVTAGVGDMVRNVFELDKSLTEFKKVSDLSGESLERYTNRAYEVGKTVAKTGSEMIQAATEFKKSGYSENDALELGRIASMYQNVADQEITAGEAANFIVSQMKAFNMTAGDSEHIIDAVNEVSNNFAVSSADIATNIGKASAALANGNVTYEQSIGLMTGMTEITRNGAKAARGLVSIQSRYNQIVDESSSTGKKLTAWYEKHNIAIKDQNGQLRSFYDVGKDVSAIWNDLSDNERRYYLNTQAGANQSQNLAALMRNYQTAIDATNTALDSNGSAANENARYMDSLEGKLQNLSSAWEDFSRKLVNSNALKTGIGALTTVLNVLSSDVGSTVVKAGLGVAAMGGAVRGLSSMFGKFAVSGAKAGRATKRLGDSAKVAGSRFTVMQRPLAKATKDAGKAGKAFEAFSGFISAPQLMLAGAAVTGIAVGFSLLYKKLEENSIENKFKRDFAAAEELEKKLQGVNAEIAALEGKRDSGGELTAEEEKRLEILKEQSKEYERQVKIKKEIARAEFKEKQEKTTPKLSSDTKKSSAYKEAYESKRKELIGKGMDRVTAAQSADKYATKAVGAVDSLTGKYVDLQTAQSKAAKANEAYRKAQEETNNAIKEYGSTSSEARAASEKETAAQAKAEQASENFKDKLSELRKERQSYLDVFDGDKDQMDKDTRKNFDAIDKVIKAYDELSDTASKPLKLNWDSSGDLDKQSLQFVNNLKDAGDMLGIVTDDMNNIKNIDYSTFSSQMQELGYSASEVDLALQAISKEHPEATVTIDGMDLAVDEAIKVNEYLEKINGNDPNATITIDGTEYAVSGIETVADLLAIMDGDTSRAQLTVDTDGDGELDATKDTMDEMDGRVDTSTLKVTAKGGEQISALSDDINEIPDTTNTTVIATGDVEPSVSEVTALSSTPPVIERTFVVTGEDNGAMPLYQQVEGAKINPKTMTVKGKTDGSFTSAKSKYEGVPRSRTATLTVGGRIAASLTNAIAKMKSALSLGGKAKGTRNAPEGLSEVNEEGWEFIRDHKTGQLRIAGGGQRTVTYLNKGDIVYTHAESKRMVVEGKDVKIPQHAKGKNNNKKKEAQDAYNNSWEKRKANYEDAIAALEYQAKAKNWTDEVLAKKVRATYNAHIKYLKSWNAKNATVKKWKSQGAKVKSNFGADVAREVHLREVEAAHDKRIQSLEKSIENLGLSAKSSFQSIAATNTKVAELTAHRKAGRITLDEYNKLRADVYKSYIEGMMDLHKVNKKSYKSMRTDLLNYAKSGKITWAEYYDYLDDLMDEQLDKQKKYLESLNDKQKNTYSLATSWVDRQIERLERQNEETSEQNELIEKQNELEKARSTRVKVYRQGQGFVYEQDVQAVKEATSELQKEQKKQESPELKAWKDVKQLLEDLELDASIKNYEVLVGKSFEQLFGSYGVDLSKWTDFAKNNLAMQHGYENLIDKLNDLEGWRDISAYLDSDGKIKADIINNSIAKNRFATGVLSTPAGFARVAEQGYEIALFGKGDAVMPHSVSENLMAWGAQSPVEYADSINQNATNQIYHFDNLVLPNVTNANTFMRELNNLPNKALQYSRGRA